MHFDRLMYYVYLPGYTYMEGCKGDQSSRSLVAQVPGSWFPVPVPPHAKLSRQSSSEPAPCLVPVHNRSVNDFA